MFMSAGLTLALPKSFVVIDDKDFKLLDNRHAGLHNPFTLHYTFRMLVQPPYSVLSTQYSVLSTQYSVLSTQSSTHEIEVRYHSLVLFLCY